MYLRRSASLLVCLAAMTTGLASSMAWGADTLDAQMGKALFERVWTPAPSSTDATDGLGPLFNARACSACHDNGGRGIFTESDDGTISGDGLLIRLGDAAGAPDPVYGKQLQTRAIQGIAPEGRPIRLKTGGVYALSLAYGRPHDQTRMGGRLATTLLGIGKLEEVDDQTILAAADPDDLNGDGISGQVNQIGVDTIGRFGWKAGQPSLKSQSAAALFFDIGLSNSLNPQGAGDCTAAQTNCLNAPTGASARFDGLEVNDTMLSLITAYLRALPAPATKDAPALFMNTGCGACHTPALPLPDGDLVAAYTDLLLHDMGDRLADGIGEADASGREWRTPPLWGLGSATRFLHDGRAKTIAEAISWHGGEATTARNTFYALPDADRQALLDFLGTL